ncbi:MAG: EpsG family protein [Candidatus Saccharibacteria bacterium]|nr:EpsG family protein [Candidatus Saccharibacteria bacterium]
MIFIAWLILAIIALVISLNLYVKKSPKAEKISFGLFLMLSFMMIFIAGFRTDYGRDLVNYAQIFKSATTFSAAWHYPLEKGYMMLNFAFNLVTHNFDIFVFALALVTLSLRMVIIKKLSVMPMLSLIIYFMLFFINNEMGQMRNAFAEVMFLMGVSCIFDDKIIKTLGWCAAAISIHMSSLMSFLVLFWDKINLNISKILFIIFISFGLGFINFVKFAKVISNITGSAHLTSKLIMYADNDISLVITILFRIIILLIFMFVAYDGSKKHRILTFCYLMSISILLLFRSLPIFAVRSSNIFRSVEILIIPEILLLFSQWDRLNSIKRSGLLFVILFMSVYCVYNFGKMLALPEYSNYQLLGI